MKNFDNVLNNLISCGIISLNDVLSFPMEELMNKLIGKYHKYKITKTSDGKWTTYVEDSSRLHGRRLIKKSKESDLYSFLISFYNIGSLEKGTDTFDSIFKEWIAYKQNFVNVRNTHHSISPSTIRRYERDYDSFIAGSALSKMELSSITPTKLETTLSDIVRGKDMTEKCTKNVLSFIRQTFKFARRSDYISKDPFESVDIDLLLSSCRISVKKDSERVLTKNEMGRLFRQVREMQELHPYYMPNYAVELALYTGMRVGELAALHWGDVRDKIYVDYSEHRLDFTGQKSELIIAEPKNKKHRTISLTPDMVDLFNRVRELNLKSPDDFIFVRCDGTRYTAHDISCAANRRAIEAGIDKTSIHEIRRTVSSLLNEVLPQRVVADILGHSENVNERFYNYSMAEEEEKINALDEVIQSYSKMVG